MSYEPSREGIASQPFTGWFAVAAFVSAATGLVMVVVSDWLTIAFLALALGIQAYGSTRRQPKIDARRIWFAVGAFVSAAIGAVLVLVDGIWLTIPISAVALGIGAFVRARQRAQSGRTRGLRIAVGALVSAVVGAVAALIGFELTLALSLLPIAVAHYRRVKRDPKAVGRNLKLSWAALLDVVTSGTIAFAIFWVALHQQIGTTLDDFRRNTAEMRTMTFATSELDHLSELLTLNIGDCIQRPKEGAVVQEIRCGSSMAYGQVRDIAGGPSSCPEGTDGFVKTGSSGRVACVVVRSGARRAR